jgi:hypothetical protein
LAARLGQLATRHGATVVDVAAITDLRLRSGEQLALLGDTEDLLGPLASAAALGVPPLHFSWLLHAIASTAFPDWRHYCLNPDHPAAGHPVPRPPVPCVKAASARLLAGQRVAVVGRREAFAEDVGRLVRLAGGASHPIVTAKLSAKAEVAAPGCGWVVAEDPTAIEADVPVLSQPHFLQSLLRGETPATHAKTKLPSGTASKRRRDRLVVRCQGPDPEAADPKPEAKSAAASDKDTPLCYGAGSLVRVVTAGTTRVARIVGIEDPSAVSTSRRARGCKAPAAAAGKYSVQFYDSVLTDGRNQREVRPSPEAPQTIDGASIAGPAFLVPATLEQFRRATYWCPPTGNGA